MEWVADILYLDEIPVSLEPVLRAHIPGEFGLWLWDRMGAEERQDKLALAEYIIVGAREVDEDFLASAQRAKLIQKIGTGTDNIDLDAAAQESLVVANAPGGNAGAVAELTILMILALYRQLHQLNTSVRAGEWPMWALRPSSFEMQGKAHGVVGFGAIGQEVAKRSRAFGAEVMYFDIGPEPGRAGVDHPPYYPLELLLRRADIVSIHVPLTPDSRHLIGGEELAMLKESAVLVNVARGGVVDEAALYTALESGQLAGAALDVWEAEPVPTHHPLLQLENVIATPHVGAGTREAYIRVLDIASENIRRVAAGEHPHNVVTEGRKTAS